MKTKYKILIIISLVTVLLSLLCLNVFAYNYSDYLSVISQYSNEYLYVYINDFEYLKFNDLVYNKYVDEYNSYVEYWFEISFYGIRFHGYSDEYGEIYNITIDRRTPYDPDGNHTNPYVICKCGSITLSNIESGFSYKNYNGYGNRLSFGQIYNVSNFDDVYFEWQLQNSDVYYYDMTVNFNDSPTIEITKEYNINFYNNPNSSIEYNKIKLIGRGADSTTIVELDQIYYNNTLVYNNGSWVSGYDNTLYYYSDMDPVNTAQINSDLSNTSIRFNKQLIKNVNPSFMTEMKTGLEMFLYPIKSFTELAAANIIISIILVFIVANAIVTVLCLVIRKKE